MEIKFVIRDVSDGCFYDGDEVDNVIDNANLYNTYPEAEEVIKTFNDKGFYQIDKVFIANGNQKLV